MEVKEFNNNDNDYLQWMEDNPSCFVVNTNREKTKKTPVIHKCLCHHITSTTGFPEGIFTQKESIKIVASSINELRSWFKDTVPGFKDFKECGTCSPTAK